MPGALPDKPGQGGEGPDSCEPRGGDWGRVRTLGMLTDQVSPGASCEADRSLKILLKHRFTIVHSFIPY